MFTYLRKGWGLRLTDPSRKNRTSLIIFLHNNLPNEIDPSRSSTLAILKLDIAICASDLVIYAKHI